MSLEHLVDLADPLPVAASTAVRSAGKSLQLRFDRQSHLTLQTRDLLSQLVPRLLPITNARPRWASLLIGRLLVGRLLFSRFLGSR